MHQTCVGSSSYPKVIECKYTVDLAPRGDRINFLCSVMLGHDTLRKIIIMRSRKKKRGRVKTMRGCGLWWKRVGFGPRGFYHVIHIFVCALKVGSKQEDGLFLETVSKL